MRGAWGLGRVGVSLRGEIGTSAEMRCVARRCVSGNYKQEPVKHRQLHSPKISIHSLSCVGAMLLYTFEMPRASTPFFSHLYLYALVHGCFHS